MKRFFQHLISPEEQQAITVVSGLPRSGTSMMMKMLEAGGMTPWTDHQRIADEDNPKGYYELERVKKLKEGDTIWLPQARGKVIKVISALLTYLPDDFQYRVIFMRRELPEILASQRKMLINRGEDPDKVSEAELIKLYNKHLNQVINWLDQKNNFSILHVNYNLLLKDPAPYLPKINRFLGNHLDLSQMAAAIDPTLYRNRQE